ncbi:thermonuclease family protein [Candidatus Shapirobacteria bacterium]|nr:thermonuclease family protein [Candidatus Shapirobacteria bacterium]
MVIIKTKTNYWIGLMFGIVGLGMGYWLRGLRQVERKIYPEENIKIIGVIDGDTIVTENKVRIRLRQIDAPELNFCGGEEAKNLLTSLVENKNVRVAENIIDTKGRPMAMIFVEGKSVNREMLQSGWVRYHSDKTSETEELIKIWNEVREQKMGIFSQKCSQTENLTDPKCNIKGNIDPDKADTKIYQMPGCVQYKTTTVNLDRGEQWFCSEKEAVEAGYVKSKRCPNPSASGTSP